MSENKLGVVITQNGSVLDIYNAMAFDLDDFLDGPIAYVAGFPRELKTSYLDADHSPVIDAVTKTMARYNEMVMLPTDPGGTPDNFLSMNTNSIDAALDLLSNGTPVNQGGLTQ
jgi:hypothetical protein